MTDLFLIRHGKSSWADESLRDQERPLNARGQQQLRALARAAQHLGALDGLVLSSHARRATQTLAGITAGKGPHTRIITKAELYTFDYRVLLKQLAIAEDERTITIVGHNPALLDLASYLLESPPDSFPTGSLMHIRLPARPWSQLKKRSGTLQALLTPKDISYSQFIRKRKKTPRTSNKPLANHIPDVLVHQYQLMRDLEAGVMHGFDDEFLHQYRIAIRRSRAIAESVVELTGDTGLKKASRHLKRHARATSALRDLHVFIANFDKTLGEAGALSFFQSAANTRHQQLKEHLQKPTYQREMDHWYRLISSSAFRKLLGKLTHQDIRNALSRRIRHYNELALTLDEHSPDEDIHTLRKLLKRIRYLIELDKPTLGAGIKDLKRWQQCLGDFQDLHVQLELLEQFQNTESCIDTGSGTINTLTNSLKRKKAKLRNKILTLGKIREIRA
ncbi:CHAD domain-containing protein [Marinobacter sp. NP-4(2019)]|uniref:CHAD domain-containing protein n=1 Tax=Marinobacter sp. NP-4(2019) TaxID=2488665 RepID=UPI000FC3E48F|nr:CHAD domain-containing protein [Marinobacter sp. NP-4(2019)]AZT82441.1 CHAD domain-containing protein [Marinobacter sp. NP-4(2019)]